MAHDTDKILTRRASLAVVAGLVLLPLIETVQAAEQPNAQQILEELQEPAGDPILDALKGLVSRGGIKEEQIFFEEMSRRQSRSITEAERDRIWNYTLDKRKIDLKSISISTRPS